MRLWSLHPKYLDAKGLVALWREALLAKHVLEGKTKGYKNHPQLNRFKESARPTDSINQYLATICEEAEQRGYLFDKRKIDSDFKPVSLHVKKGQVKFELAHLLRKLKTRDPKRYRVMKMKKRFEVHPIFTRINGGIEEWEILK
jgi:hypothetical protein